MHSLVAPILNVVLVVWFYLFLKRNMLRRCIRSLRSRRVPEGDAIAMSKQMSRERARQEDLEDRLSIKHGQATEYPRGPTSIRPRARPAGEAKLLENRKRGAELAETVKTMSDHEWEALPIQDKHSFTQYMKKRIATAPAEVTEQQRRRYYETTMFDPTNEDPSASVQDTFQRIKMGLPVEITPQRNLGVAQAIYEASEAELFDPENAYRLENAMTELKQKFVDYVKRRREGVSTENERRALAHLSAELNYNTQRHLANMFKYAEQKIRDVTLEEKKRQQKQYAAMRRALERRLRAKQQKEAASQRADGEDVGEALKASKEFKKDKVQRTLRDTYGLDVTTVERIVQEMKAQAAFLEMCEVTTRMTLGAGFRHTPEDESLGEYVDTMKSIYATDPEQFGQLDAVKFAAAVDAVPPVDWATRWFQKTLLLPLQETPEYKALQELKEEEKRLRDAAVEAGRQNEDDEVGSTEEKPDAKTGFVGSPAERREKKVTDLVEKMFLRPEDTRLKTIHEQRLRHLAYLHMESQIKRMRENAKKYDGVENTPEAAECRELYQQIQELKAQLAPDANPFQDPKIAELYGRIQTIVNRFIGEKKAVDEADVKLRQAKSISKKVKLGGLGAAALEIRRINKKKQEEQVHRMLRLLEKDVREDMLWLENLQEAERPPLLPVPEPLPYVSAAEVADWKTLREEKDKNSGNPFLKGKKGTTAFSPKFLGQPWKIPDKPIMFWGTGVTAVQQALRHAAEDAERRRSGQPLAPEHPTAENPFGWRLRRDPLDA